MNNNEKIEQPIDLLILEYKESILKAIDNSKYNFPMVLKQMIVKEIKEKVDMVTNNIVKLENENYQKSLQEENKKDGENINE